MTLDEAPAYYTEVIESVNDSKEAAAAYDCRAVAWRKKANSTKRSPTTPNGFDWLLTRSPTTAAESPGRPKRSTTRRSPTSARPSCSIRATCGPTTTAASPGTPSETSRPALHDYNQAIQLNPNFASACNNAAWLLATCPEQRYRDGRRAIGLATKACDLTAWTNANVCGTLAAAYAETGDFDAAVKYQLKAIELNPKNPEFLRGANARLAGYKEHKAYRDE